MKKFYNLGPWSFKFEQDENETKIQNGSYIQFSFNCKTEEWPFRIKYQIK